MFMFHFIFSPFRICLESGLHIVYQFICNLCTCTNSSNKSSSAMISERSLFGLLKVTMWVAGIPSISCCSQTPPEIFDMGRTLPQRS